MSIFVSRFQTGRSSWQMYTGVTLAAVCIGMAGVTSLAAAQGTDNGEPGGNAAAQPQRNAPVQAPLVAEDPIDPNQPIKASFGINISVDGEPEPSGDYVVQPGGDILLKIAEIQAPIKIVNQTPDEAAITIATFLKKYIRNPHVTVTIISVPKAVVNITGAMRTTGPIVISQSTTLVELLSKAQWIDNSDLSHVFLIRRTVVNGKEKLTQQVLQADAYLKPAPGSVPDEKQNPILQDRDTIFVPFKSLSSNSITTTITISGEVNKPAPKMDLRTSPPMTLREVISLAGGVTANADRKAVSIRRANSTKPIIVDLDKALAGDPANNIELQPDDSIFVGKTDMDQQVNVEGGFLRPGSFPINGPLTLSQVIMKAGGPLPFAKVKQGYVLRHPDSDPKHDKKLTFNFNSILSGKEPDLSLQAGDTIYIEPGAPAAGGQNANFLQYLLGPLLFRAIP